MKQLSGLIGCSVICAGLLFAQEKTASTQARDPHASKDQFSSVKKGSDADQASPKQIRVQMELVEVTQENYDALLFGRELKVDATPLRKELQEWIKQGKAKIVETTMCVSMSGQKAKTESIDEYIYPTEYEPAATIENKEGGKTTYEVATPAAFETRNLGTTCEFDPMLDSGGKFIHFRYDFAVVWLTGESIWSSRKDSLNNIEEMKMPRIYSVKSKGELALLNGKYAFASVLTPRDAQGRADGSRKLLLFMKGDVLVPEP